MKERPVIFNGEMVRAILDGRKTKTRRPINPQPTLSERTGFNWKGAAYGIGSTYRDTVRNFANCFKTCPFGRVGDRLWVREAYQGPLFNFDQMETYLEDTSKFERPEFCEYRADGGRTPEYYDADDNLRYGWKPSIHMPRWASRITLEITTVRVERLNDISEEDARAEGCCYGRGGGVPDFAVTPADHFPTLWASIYGEESWRANPWVWVIEFRRVEVEK
ncbi:morphogenetic protein [Serratia marcescens]|nr:morphogenetic protein [Serratia marcescens]